MINEIFAMAESALKKAREAAAELEALKAKLKSHPEFDSSASAAALADIEKALSD